MAPTTVASVTGRLLKRGKKRSDGKSCVRQTGWSTSCRLTPPVLVLGVLQNMNSKLFWTIALAMFAAGVCLYLFVRWHLAEEKMRRREEEDRRLAAFSAGRREIGFAAMLAEQ